MEPTSLKRKADQLEVTESEEEDVVAGDIDVCETVLDESELIIVRNENEVCTYLEAKQSQQAELDRLREESASEDSIDHRLSYLMKQSEIFAHFMVGDRPGSESTTGQAEGDKRGRKRKSTSSSSDKHNKSGKARTILTEEQEDQDMMKAAQSSSSVTWLNSQPSCIVGGKMRPYQLEGLNWLIRLHDNNINGVLADEMGLGKTLQVISLLGYLQEHRNISGPHLIISPKSTISGWMRECARWCPSLRAIRLQGNKEERAIVCKTQMKPGQFDVVIASNESCLIESKFLMRFKWRYVIIDEAHRIKNEKSSLSKLVRLLHTDFKLLITGTPLQNNLHELWALLNFLLPDVFNCADSFDSWFNTSDSAATENVVKRLHSVLKPFMLRRVKIDVEADIPPKIETKLYVGLTDMQRSLYTKILSKDIITLNATASSADKVRLLNTLMQLRKVCNHPYLFDGQEEGPPYYDGPHIWQNCGKMVVLNRLLPKLFAQGNRVLLFSQMTRMLDIVEDYLRLNDYQYCRIDGSTDSATRDKAMDDFNKKGSDKFCFLLSTRAGGLGINLQTADTVILYDSDWNPQADLQAMDRAHRIGQTKVVRVFRLVTERTVEEKVVERADRKLFLDAAVIQQGRLADKHSQLSKSELLHMVRFGADEIMNTRDGTITDEDIDHLLRRGEERTKEDSDKLKTEMQHNLANFAVGLEDSHELNLFNFEGEDFKKKSAGSGTAEPLTFISLPQRERKKTFDVNSYFREALGVSASSTQPKDKVVKRKRAFSSAPDYHFYDKPFLEAYADQEDALRKQKSQQLEAIRTLLAKDSKARRSSKRLSTAGSQADTDGTAVESGEQSEVTTNTAGGAGVDVSSELSEFAMDAARLQQEIDEGKLDMPPEVVEARTQKIAEAFGTWNRMDYKVFVDALERYGRSRELVAQALQVEAKKSKEEGERYFDVFFSRYTEVTDWQRIIEKADRGDKRAAREREIHIALDKKLSRHPNPWIHFPFAYHGSKGRMYSEDNDLFIILTLHKHGYGCWEKMKKEIRAAPQFRFDWFIKSRSNIELQRRSDFLIRLVEKEIDALAALAAMNSEVKEEST